MDEVISVIIPVYNVEKYLNECIKSVCNQTYSQLEILLIDDGSTDASGEICDRYAILDERIKVVHKENGGLSSARNTGLSKANGKYICFLDSDDYLADSFIMNMLKVLVEKKADIVECEFEKQKEKKLNNKQSLDRREALRRYVSSEYYYPNVSVCNKLYKSEIIKDMEFPIGKIHEDYLFQCVAFSRINTYAFVKEPLYYYRVRSESITHRDFDIKDFDKLYIYKKRTEFLKTLKDDELIDLALAEEFIILFSFLYKSYEKDLEIKMSLEDELKQRKKEFFKIELPLKRKMIYMLFYIHPRIYLLFRKVVEAMTVR